MPQPSRASLSRGSVAAAVFFFFSLAACSSEGYVAWNPNREDDAPVDAAKIAELTSEYLAVQSKLTAVVSVSDSRRAARQLNDVVEMARSFDRSIHTLTAGERSALVQAIAGGSSTLPDLSRLQAMYQESRRFARRYDVLVELLQFDVE